MVSRYDEGFARVQRLAARLAEGDHLQINEAATRLRFIDELLFECLDWDKAAQAEPELRDIDGGYLDYALKPDGSTLLVVEAKRAGIYFELPVEQVHSRERSISALRSISPSLAAAMDQVAQYAFNQGAPLAVVTNGWQLVAFSVRAPMGKRWIDGRAFVFKDANELVAGFPILWEALSVTGVRNLHLIDQLSGSLETSSPSKRSATIPNYNRLKGRNDLQSELQILADLVFGDALFTDRQLFHEHCYCDSGSLPNNRKLARDYFQQLYPERFSELTGAPTLKPARTRGGIAEELKRPAAIKKPVLVLGDVGVGKSTFLEHLFLREINDPQLILIRLDLSDKPSTAEDLAGFTLGEISRSLRERYQIDIAADAFLRGVYHGELARLASSPVGRVRELDPQRYLQHEIDKLEELARTQDRHIESIFRHIQRGQGRKVALVFDNVDQRLEMQEPTFILAQIAASTWDVFTMVTLRPSTLARSTDISPLKGYQPFAFTVYPPRFDKMLQRRVSTAIKMFRGELALPLPEGSAVRVQTVADYLQILYDTFDRSSDIVEFCENVSNGNVRESLGYIAKFMACGHVDAEKILRNWRESGSYWIPLHEFTKAVMFFDREHYSGSHSSVCNVFDYSSGDDREIFAVLAILGALAEQKENHPDEFLSRSDVRGKMANAGFSAQQADAALRRCLEHVLAESGDKTQTLGEQTEVRLTARGNYYRTKLVRSFVYAETVCTDTPIRDPVALKSLGGNSDLESRLRMCETFLGYLEKTSVRFPEVRSLVHCDELCSDIRKDMQRASDSAWRRTSKTKSRR